MAAAASDEDRKKRRRETSFPCGDPVSITMEEITRFMDFEQTFDWIRRVAGDANRHTWRRDG